MNLQAAPLLPRPSHKDLPLYRGPCRAPARGGRRRQRRKGTGGDGPSEGAEGKTAAAAAQDVEVLREAEGTAAGRGDG